MSLLSITVMKLLYMLATTLLLISTARAQKIDWKEMDTFHTLSNQTLHPALAGNFQPVKQNSELLLADAINWQKSKAPTGYDTPQIKADIDKLVKQCIDLNNAVKTSKSDDDIRSLADITHKTFHVLLAECTANN
jgi:hypothetical protein